MKRQKKRAPKGYVDTGVGCAVKERAKLFWRYDDEWDYPTNY